MRARRAAFPGAAEELDVTMFEPGPQLAAAERAAAELVAKARVTLALRSYESCGGGLGEVSGNSERRRLHSAAAVQGIAMLH